MTLKSAILAAVTGEAAQETDPYYNLVSLHLKGDVNTGRSYNAFSDASSNNFRLTNNGDVRGSSFSPYGTSWSAFFDGTNDYVATPVATNVDLGTSNFTIEGWVYVSATANKCVLAISNAAAYPALMIQIGPTSAIFGSSTANSSWDVFYQSLTGLSNISNTWAHFAVSRSGNNFGFFINGLRVATATSAASIESGSNAAYIGVARDNNGFSDYFSGYISNVRLVKGSVVYDPTLTTLTVPTSPLTAIANTQLLLCQSGRFIDSDSPNTPRTGALALTLGDAPRISSFSPFLETDTITGSGYFDGTGDFLSVDSNAAFQLGVDDFSIEAWIYPTATPSGQYPVVIRLESGGYNGNGLTLLWRRFNVNPNGMSVDCGGVVSLAGTSTVALNTWTHVAVTRTGNAFALFVNGNREATTTSSNNFSVNNSVYIGDSTSDTEFPGYISNVRIVKGSNVYGVGTTLTVPTQPLTTNVSPGTVSLLTLQERGAYNTIGFQDESEYQHIITRPSGANVAQGTFSPFSPNGWSVYWATGGIINYDTTTVGTDFNPGASNFTMEMWLIPLSTAATLVNWGHNDGSGSAGIMLNLSGNSLSFTVNASDGAHPGNTSVSISYTNWTHIALVRNGVALTLYVNGVPSATSSIGAAATVNTGSWYEIGQLRFGVSPTFKGYLSNFRMNFNAVYTVDFSNALPTGPLASSASTRLLILQSNQPTKDASSYNKSPYLYSNGWQLMPTSPFKPVAYDPAVHGGSGFFDGTTDFLDLPVNNAFAIGTGDFTFDCWVYPLASNSGLFTMTASGVNDLVISNNWNPSTGSTTSGTASVTLGSTNITGPTNAVTQNTWNHIAVVRRSGSVRVYVNGAGGTQTANTTSVSGSYAPRIGALYTHSASATPACYVSSMRLLKGVAVYDPSQATISVPSGPLPILPNTSLLLNFTNGGVIDSTGKNVIETSGNAGVVTTTIKKYGSGSMYFDGTGDLLYLPSSRELTFGTGDFTIEGWAYFSSVSGGVLFDWRSDGAGFDVYLSTGTLNLSTSGTYYGGTSGITLVTGQWYHIAITRAGTAWRIYVNGTQYANITNSTNFTASILRIGFGAGNTYFNGNFDDIRITKGYARYVTGTGANANQMVFNGTNTLAFPTKAFPDRGTTSILTTDMAAPSSVEALVVAGGGGGGYGGASGGGGGAGGFREFIGGNAIAVAGSTNYAISIGAGGVGGTSTVSRSDGLPSTFGSVTAIGGGGGGGVASVVNSPGSNGGSGGGGQGNSGNSGAGGKGVYPGSTYLDATRQGYDGGAGATTFHGGGGGGAGGAGAAGSSAAGAGGVGAQSSITGIATFYAGGGGGGSGSGGGTAGNGGGGAGGAGDPSNGSAGTANTGGGGGGARGGTGVGGAGGSGVVILAYPTSFRPLKASLGLVYTIDTVTRPGYRVYRFTSGTGSISW
jgi:hypothetical protein